MSETVWVFSWDVRNAGTGVEVYGSHEGAVQGLIAAVQEHGGLGEDGGPLREEELAEIRENAETTGYAHFEDADCYYGISKEEVRP